MKTEPATPSPPPTPLLGNDCRAKDYEKLPRFHVKKFSRVCIQSKSFMDSFE